MKSMKYVLAAGCVALLASCSGNAEYRQYVEDLKAQPEAIDTITSGKSYADYLNALAVKAQEFEQLGIKLDNAQQDELTALSVAIQQALEAKYEQLASTPAILPDSVVVEDVEDYNIVRQGDIAVAE